MVSTKRKWQIWDELTEALIPALAGLTTEELHWLIEETQCDGWVKMTAGDVLNLPDEARAKVAAKAEPVCRMRNERDKARADVRRYHTLAEEAQEERDKARANADDLQCVGCGIKPEDWIHEPVFRLCKDGVRCVNCMRLEDGVGSVALDTQPTIVGTKESRTGEMVPTARRATRRGR